MADPAVLYCTISIPWHSQVSFIDFLGFALRVFAECSRLYDTACSHPWATRFPLLRECLRSLAERTYWSIKVTASWSYSRVFPWPTHTIPPPFPCQVSHIRVESDAGGNGIRKQIVHIEFWGRLQFYWCRTNPRNVNHTEACMGVNNRWVSIQLLHTNEPDLESRTSHNLKALYANTTNWDVYIDKVPLIAIILEINSLMNSTGTALVIPTCYYQNPTVLARSH